MLEFRKLFPQLLSWVALFFGIATFALAVRICFWTYSPLPCLDNWYFISIYHRYTQGMLSLPALLWSMHNGHRIIIPHLFHLADLTLFGGTNLFLLSSIFLAQLVHTWSFDYLGSQTGGFRGASRRVVLGFVLFCLFCPTQRENFTCGWEIAYILPFVFGTLAFCSLAVYAKPTEERSAIRWMVICIAAALAGTYSLASGILIWPALLLEAIALRLSRRAFSVIGSFALAVFILRLFDVSTNDTGFLVTSAANRGQVFRYFLELFSTSWSASGKIPGFIFTAVAILSVFALLLGTVIRPSKGDYIRPALLAVCTFTILNAVMTALARWNRGIAGRYETPMYLFWCALGLIVFTYVESFWADRGLMAFEVAFAVAVGFGLKSVPRLQFEARAIGEWFRTAQSAMASGVLSTDAVRIVAMRVPWTFGELDFLAQRRASLYSTSPTSLKGEQLLRHFTLSPGECAGGFRGIAWAHEDRWPGIVLSGWVGTSPQEGRLKWIIVTDEQRKIVGFGSSAGWTQAREAEHGVDPVRTDWLAFAPANAEQGNLFFYRLLGPHSVCALPSKPVLPAQWPAVFDDTEEKDLVDVWKPDSADIKVRGGTAALKGHVLTVQSTDWNTELVLNTKVDLRQFETLVFKVRFQRLDSVELLFGRQANGRSMLGSTPVAGQWVYVFVQVGRNPFWKQEAGSTLRFDPTGAQGVFGSSTEISQIWGSRKATARGPDPFEFALARRQQP
jgi:hypothetical protein